MPALVLLDLSAAFDLIDHSILIIRLLFTFGIEYEAVSCKKSYLSDRIQHILIASCKSADSELDCGLPLRCVLGPKMYCMY